MKRTTKSRKEENEPTQAARPSTKPKPLRIVCSGYQPRPAPCAPQCTGDDLGSSQPTSLSSLVACIPHHPVTQKVTWRTSPETSHAPRPPRRRTCPSQQHSSFSRVHSFKHQQQQRSRVETARPQNRREERRGKSPPAFHTKEMTCSIVHISNAGEHCQARVDLNQEFGELCLCERFPVQCSGHISRPHLPNVARVDGLDHEDPLLLI